MVESTVINSSIYLSQRIAQRNVTGHKNISAEEPSNSKSILDNVSHGFLFSMIPLIEYFFAGKNTSFMGCQNHFQASVCLIPFPQNSQFP